MRSDWSRADPNPATGVLIRRPRGGSETHGEADGRDVATNQGAPGTPRHWRRQEGPSSRASGGSVACPHLGSRLLASSLCGLKFSCSDPPIACPFVAVAPGNDAVPRHEACSCRAPSLLLLCALNCVSGAARGVSHLHRDQAHTHRSLPPPADASLSVSKMALSRNVFGATRKQAKQGSVSSAAPGCWAQRDCAGLALGPPVQSPPPHPGAQLDGVSGLSVVEVALCSMRVKPPSPLGSRLQPVSSINDTWVLSRHLEESHSQ